MKNLIKKKFFFVFINDYIYSFRVIGIPTVESWPELFKYDPYMNEIISDLPKLLKNPLSNISKFLSEDGVRLLYVIFIFFLFFFLNNNNNNNNNNSNSNSSNNNSNNNNNNNNNNYNN